MEDLLVQLKPPERLHNAVGFSEKTGEQEPHLGEREKGQNGIIEERVDSKVKADSRKKRGQTKRTSLGDGARMSNPDPVWVGSKWMSVTPGIPLMVLTSALSMGPCGRSSLVMKNVNRARAIRISYW